MSSFKQAVTSSPATESFTGRVKWFNNKAGYGFITITDGTRSGTDVFAHHSSISVSNQQYKYLVQGEYVEFSLSDTQNDKHEFQASNICGIKAGQLMCETRHSFKVARTSYKTSKTDTLENEVSIKETIQKTLPVKNSSTEQTTKVRGEGPRDGDKKTWSVVGKNTKYEGKPRGRPPKQNLEAK